MVRLQRSLHYEDLDQGFVEVLEDLEEVLVQSSKRSLHDLVQVLVRRSGGDPGEILSKRFQHEDLEDVLLRCA
jgi:hypothetical protein